MADAWSVLGALAGAGGTLTAALAIWQSGAQTRVQALREEANATRQEINAFKASFDRLLPNLRTGETLLALSEHVTQSFHKHYAITNVAELNAAMDAISERISLLVRWIETDPVARSFKAERLTLQVAASHLGARLPIFSDITNLLKAIMDDVLSAVFFVRFFNPGMREIVLRDLNPNTSPAQIESFLASQTASNAALYFSSRYNRAIGLMDELVKLLAEAHLSLRDEQLHAIAARAKTLPPSQTRIGAMRNYLRISAPFIGKGAAAKISALLDPLETAISKEEATREAARIKSAD